MPTEAFYKLDETRRRAITDAAVGEFSEKPYEKVSVFKIAQSTGMSRSGFYYYFTDKDDVYRYLLSELKADFDSVISGYETARDIFEFFESMFRRIISGSERRRGEFIRRVFENMHQSDNTEFLDRLGLKNDFFADMHSKGLKSIEKKCDFSNLKFNDAERIRELEYLLFSVVTYAAQKYFSGECDAEAADAKLRTLFDFIGRGVLKD